MGKYDQGVFKKAMLKDLQKHYDVTGQGMTYNHKKLKDYCLMTQAFNEMEQEGLVEIDTDEEMGFTTYSIKVPKAEIGEKGSELTLPTFYVESVSNEEAKGLIKKAYEECE